MIYAIIAAAALIALIVRNNRLRRLNAEDRLAAELRHFGLD